LGYMLQKKLAIGHDDAQSCRFSPNAEARRRQRLGK
jgi:hypothetical protein